MMQTNVGLDSENILKEVEHMYEAGSGVRPTPSSMSNRTTSLSPVCRISGSANVLVPNHGEPFVSPAASAVSSVFSPSSDRPMAGILSSSNASKRSRYPACGASNSKRRSVILNDSVPVFNPRRTSDNFVTDNVEIRERSIRERDSSSCNAKASKIA